MKDDSAKLSEFDADEWFDICRYLRPDLTREEFDAQWREFQAFKSEVLRKRNSQ